MFLRLQSMIKGVGDCLGSYLLLVIRLYWGFQFFITGLGKLANLDTIATYFASLGIPFPFLNALLAGSVELIGGALLFLGLFSRIAAIPLFCLMVVAFLTAELDAVALLFSALDPTQLFSRTPFLFAYGVLIVFCFGPGRFSLDHYCNRSSK